MVTSSIDTCFDLSKRCCVCDSTCIWLRPFSSVSSTTLVWSKRAPGRVIRFPGLPGTVPEWKEMSSVPARSIPGQRDVPEWIILELNSLLLLCFSKIGK